MIVLTGTVGMILQLSGRISYQEKRLKRVLFNEYLTDHFRKPENCKATLEDLKLAVKTGGNKANKDFESAENLTDSEGNPTPPDDRAITVAALKRPNSGGGKDTIMDFANDADRLKRDFGTDKFYGLYFQKFVPQDKDSSGDPEDIDFSSSGDTEHGEAELKLITQAYVMGQAPQFQPPFYLKLTGVQVKKDGHSTGKHKLTACSLSAGGGGTGNLAATQNLAQISAEAWKDELIDDLQACHDNFKQGNTAAKRICAGAVTNHCSMKEASEVVSANSKRRNCCFDWLDRMRDCWIAKWIANRSEGTSPTASMMSHVDHNCSQKFRVYNRCIRAAVLKFKDKKYIPLREMGLDPAEIFDGFFPGRFDNW